MDSQYELDLEHHNVVNYIYSGPESAENCHVNINPYT